MLDRALIAAAVAVVVAGLVLAGRGLARRRLARLRSLPAGTLWTALETAPDGRATVVSFSTPSCAACWTAQKPALAVVEDWAEGAVRVIWVDAAERPEVARAFGVLTVPATVVISPGGEVLAANQGFAPAERLAEQLGVASPSTASLAER